MDFRGYGGVPPPGPGGQPDPLYGLFSSVAGQDGQISAVELQACLTQFGITGTYKPFSLETCKLMISMLDTDYSGSMGFSEFTQLMSVLNAWKQNFMSIDQDRSGAVNAQEMQQSLASQGYRLSPQVLNIIIKRYSVQGQIPFDEYVACCIKLRSLTQLFQSRDTTRQGTATFQYDDFIQCTMST